MTFENLPENWSDRPLSDPFIAAGVVDLFISEADRRHGKITVLLCDEQDRLLLPVALDGLEDATDIGPEDSDVLLRPFLEALQVTSGCGLLVAVGRYGSSEWWPEVDGEWATEVARVCEEAGVRLIGFYVATVDGIVRAEVSAVV